VVVLHEVVQRRRVSIVLAIDIDARELQDHLQNLVVDVVYATDHVQQVLAVLRRLIDVDDAIVVVSRE
jgi:hypothetical protein